jgi:hypothetical protein
VTAMNKPPDDPRWCPMLEAIELRTAQLGDRDMAILDLEQAIESGKLRGMRWSCASGESERLTAPFRELFAWFYGHRALDDWLYSVWKPDLDALFSVSQADPGAAPKAPRLPIDRAEAVLRDLYPTKVQMPRSLKEATKTVATGCGKRGWQVPSSDSVHRAAVRLGFRTPRKHR